MSKQVYSPYKAAAIVSEQLGYKVAPQQLYGLIRKNEKLQVRNNTGHLVVDDSFIEAYVAGRIEAAEKKAAKDKVEATEAA
jgi:hypothetical protein